jgi:dTDP-glucose 4,6-dehydratase
MILNITENKDLPVYGDGQNVRDWLFVLDHCDALLTVLDKGMAGETYNIGGGAELPNIDVVNLLCALLDQKLGRKEDFSSARLVKFVQDRPGHDRRYAIDATKIRETLGWYPEHNFHEAIAKTVDWYLANPAWVQSIRSGEYLKWIDKNYGHR